MSRVLLAIALLAAGYSARADAPEVARTAGVRALALAADRRHEEAMAEIRRALQGVAPEPAEAAEAARAILYFHMGYVATRGADAAAEPDGAARQLRTAVGAYRRVLALRPGNAKAAVNLALIEQRLGRSAEAILLLEETGRAGDAGADRADGALLRLALGDAYARANRPREAMEAYYAVAERDFGDDRAHSRILGLHRASADTGRSSEQMLQYCERLAANGRHNAAARGFADVAARTVSERPELAEQALVLFAEMRAKLGSLTRASLLQLPAPARWRSSALRELVDLVSGDPAVERMQWWTEGASRRRVAAAVLTARATATAAPRAGAEPALLLYDAALRLAPDAPAATDAALRMLELLNARPDLDPESDRSKATLDRYLDSRALDGATLQDGERARAHAAIGLILAERNPADPRATEHLVASMRAAAATAERERRDADPMPGVRRALANSLGARGDVEAAARESIEAAKACLSLRAERDVSRALAEAGAWILRAPPAARAGLQASAVELAKFADERRELKQAPPAERERKLEELDAALKVRAEREPAGSVVGAKFWMAQRRSLNFELERDSLRAGDAATAEKLSARARRLQLDSGALDKRLEAELEGLRIESARLGAGNVRRDG